MSGQWKELIEMMKSCVPWASDAMLEHALDRYDGDVSMATNWLYDNPEPVEEPPPIEPEPPSVSDSSVTPPPLAGVTNGDVPQYTDNGRPDPNDVEVENFVSTTRYESRRTVEMYETDRFEAMKRNIDDFKTNFSDTESIGPRGEVSNRTTPEPINNRDYSECSSPNSVDDEPIVRRQFEQRDKRFTVDIPEMTTTRARRIESRTKELEHLELFIKVLIPVGPVPRVLLEEQLETLLRKCHVIKHEILRRFVISRAEYEDQVEEWRLNITIRNDGCSDKVELLTQFLERFSYNSYAGMHDQISIEVPGVPRIVNEIKPQHCGIPIAMIDVGSCPSPGVFFIRGNYITFWNKISNRNLMRTHAGRRDGQRRPEEMAQFQAAGKHEYLSFANFEHDRRHMNIYFATDLQKEQADGLLFAGYRISLQYNAIVEIVVDYRDPKVYHLMFRLKHPPQVWETVAKPPPYQHSHRIVNLEASKMEWVRVLQWPAAYGNGRLRSFGCSQEALADCQYLRISIPRGGECVDSDPRMFLSLVSRLMMRSSAKISFRPVCDTLKRLPVVQDISSVGSFRADYALKAMISRGSIVTDQLFDYIEVPNPVEPTMIKVIRWCMKECQRACEEALENLLCAVDERRSMNLLKAFYHMYSSRVETYRRLEQGDFVPAADVRRALPQNCVMVRKVMVTPLRILFLAPEVMMSNRVVRHFGEENALRCVFRDDSGNRLIVKEFLQGGYNDQQSTIIAGIVQRTLSHGVQIHDRHYYFLAWSNSQMRDHGCYMYAPVMDPTTGDILVSIDQMREWMGDFSSSKNVPKLMSRMGQCFTQAQPSILLTPDMWIVEPDIEGGKGHPETGEDYCYSDGCGRISAALALEISIILELKIVPSCFQVRFKGFKGVLAIDPALDQRASGPQVIFRKSQQKFVDADDENGTLLEIVKYAMPSPVCLNRPMITILDWVAERQSSELHKKLCRKIHYYLEKELSNLGAMLINERAASEGLTQRVNLPIDFNRLRQCGFSLTNEPFIRKMLVSVYRYNINNHLSKAKIFLPANMGRSMYGIVDETGLLQYGQVFIQYSPSLRQASHKPLLYTGPVLITKNPCHVAGDVRMFTAVDQPALRHLFDVVVFPQHGPRPHPDEMAGSDLDGDEYGVVFDPDIAFHHNEEAMVFPKSTPVNYAQAPTTEDMVDFFLKYLRQDSIGRMSNAHLIMADRRGLFDETCNDIARKCSIAVDFPKSGEPADQLTPMEQCDVVPDYIYSAVKPMYRSTRLNGQLFRKAKKVEDVLELTEKLESVFENDIDRIIVPVGADLFEGAEQIRTTYRRLRDEYATRMQQLLDEYGITDEAAIVSGHIVSLKRLTAMERDDYSFYHTDKIVELRYAKIFNHFREIFFQEFGGEESRMEVESNGTRMVHTDSVMELKARRWYQICYVDTAYVRRAQGPSRSFAWVAWDVLAAFKRSALMASRHIDLDECPVESALGREIDRFLVHPDTAPGFSDFVLENEEDGGIVQKYAVAYGTSFMQAMYVLYNWLEQDQFFSYSRMTTMHVALLFIQFCRGIRHGAEGVSDSSELVIILPEAPPEPPTLLPYPPMNVPRTLVGFLRYLSSQRFALADHIDLRVDGEKTAPVLIRSNLWLPLSQLAFRTYHHIAVSGRFDALRVSETPDDWNEGESRDPTLVSHTLFDDSYNEAPLARVFILDTLKEWTGVSEIQTRYLNPGRRNTSILLTSVGTVGARQRLARLLLMPVDRLRKAVREGRMPAQVRDESL